MVFCVIPPLVILHISVMNVYFTRAVQLIFKCRINIPASCICFIVCVYNTMCVYVYGCVYVYKTMCINVYMC